MKPFSLIPSPLLTCGAFPVLAKLADRKKTAVGRIVALAALVLTLGTGQAMAQRAVGIDVSRWQNTVNWTSVKNAGYSFAWAQATRGNYLTNHNYVANMNNGKSAGVLMGSYHYATPATNSAATEAQYFWNRAGAHILADGKTLMPMLDIEEWNGHIGASSYSEWANQWANWVVNKAASNGVNIKIVLYSSASFMCNFNSSVSHFGSWVANYGGNPQTGTPWDCCTSCNLWGGGSWDFWQHSSTGTVPGVSGNCDLDVFNGTVAQLSAWKATAMVAPVISGVSASSVGNNSATITWTTDINSDTVVNYGLTTSYGTTVSNGTKVVNHSINLTGLNPSTTYHFRVKSKNHFGQTSTSGDFTFTTLAPGQVNDIIIDNPQATYVGTWTTASTATDKFGADYRYKGQGTGSSYAQFTPTILTAGNYDLYEWHTQGGNRGTDTPHVITYNGGSITLDVNQQINGGQWNYLGTFNFATGTAGRVRINDAITGGTLLSMADALKWVYVPAVTPPAAPSGLTATAVSTSQINLTWNDNSNNEDNFKVRRSTTSGGPYTDIATVGANVTSYNNTGLSASTTYYYVVRASNSGGNSANSGQASATTFGAPPPNEPSGLTATAVSSTQINLTWTDNSSNETGFRVERSTDNVNFTQFISLSANVTSTSSSGLNGSTTYYFRVRAYNANGNSAYSAVASATTQPVADIIIDNPSATVTGTWSTGTASTDKFGTNYRFKNAGTGSSYLTFRPNILVAGNYHVYEWHPQGANRTTAAPCVINYNGSTQTVFVDQQVNGGTWVFLGTFNFVTGTTGYARITDNFAGTSVVMADAIKFVYAP